MGKCSDVILFKESIETFEKSYIQTLKNLTICHRDFCEPFEDKITFVKFTEFTDNIEASYKNYFVPGNWLLNNFFPIYFEFHSYESELLTYEALCNDFYKIMNKSESIYGHFISKSFLKKEQDIPKQIYDCKFGKSFAKYCKSFKKRYSYYDHKILGVKCPKILSFTNHSNFVRSMRKRLFFFISFLIFYSI